MAHGQYEAVLKPPQGLRKAEAVAEVTDGQLLARFAACRDDFAEIAFEALVRRHGPMVLRVCQQVLGDRHTAEDAFQATFLILARRAGSIRQPELLGHWLHGVALRTAREARMRDDRRRRREGPGGQVFDVERAGPSPRPDQELVDPRGVRRPARGGLAPAGTVSHPGRALRSRGADVPGGGTTAAMPARHDRRAAQAGARTAPDAADSTRAGPDRRTARRAAARRGRRRGHADGPDRFHRPGRDGIRGSSPGTASGLVSPAVAALTERCSGPWP